MSFKALFWVARATEPFSALIISSIVLALLLLATGRSHI
jgi:hypothetical protein